MQAFKGPLPLLSFSRTVFVTITFMAQFHRPPMFWLRLLDTLPSSGPSSCPVCSDRIMTGFFNYNQPLTQMRKGICSWMSDGGDYHDYLQ